jgi:hypothetical protein
MLYLVDLTYFRISLKYLNDTIQYAIHDTIQNSTIHDTKCHSTTVIRATSAYSPYVA